MNTHSHSEPPTNQLPEAAKEAADKIVNRTADAARETAQRATAVANEITGVVENLAGNIANAAKDAETRATEMAKEVYRSATLKAGETLATSKEYVRRNPVPVVLGAIAFGAALGYMLMMARRKPTFGERYADEPLSAVREAILGALAPVAQRVHEGYDSARDGAGKAIERVQRVNPGQTADSLSNQICRVGSNLKFW